MAAWSRIGRPSPAILARRPGRALWAVGVFHLIVVCYAFRHAGDLASLPIRNDDSASHFYSALHADSHWRAVGLPFGYDPGWMAGYPEGAIGMVDNKLFYVLLSLAPAGWEAAAYNAGYLLALLSAPWLLYGAARAAGASSASASGAAFCAVLAMFTVPIVVHFALWGGVSYLFASVLVVPATTFLSACVAGDRAPGGRRFGAFALSFLAVFVHPAILPPLLAGLVPAALVARRRPVRLLADAAWISVALGAALLPLGVAYANLRAALMSSDPQGNFLHGGIGQLRDDWWIALTTIDLRPHGAGGLLGLFLLPLTAAWSQAAGSATHSSDRRVARWTVVFAELACAALAYLAPSLWPRVADLQPYRYVLPLAFFACLPAGEALARHVAERRGIAGKRWVLGLVAVAFAVRAGLALAPLLVFGVGWDGAEEALVRLVQREGGAGGRWVVESRFQPMPSAAGSPIQINLKRFALMPLRTGAEFLGYSGTGPLTAQRYAAYRHGILLGRPLSKLDAAGAEDLFGRYAVTHVVGCAGQTLRDLRRLGTVVEPVAPVGDCWAFRVRLPRASRVLEGRGEVRAGLDRIEVRAAAGERVVLKYHWVPTLRTEPPLPIEEAPQPGAPVGFIAVRPGGVRDFDVVQTARSLPEIASGAWRALAVRIGELLGSRRDH